jgi:hypothetical protein
MRSSTTPFDSIRFDLPQHHLIRSDPIFHDTIRLHPIRSSTASFDAIRFDPDIGTIPLASIVCIAAIRSDPIRSDHRARIGSVTRLELGIDSIRFNRILGHS